MHHLREPMLKNNYNLKNQGEEINMEEGETTQPINFHLEDLNLIGGLTMPKSNSHWKSLPNPKVKLNPQPQIKNTGIKKAGRGK